MKINPGNARGLLVPQGDRPFSFVVYSSEIRDFGFGVNGIRYLKGLGYFHVEVDFIECSSWTAQGCAVRNALWSQNHGTEKAN